jgi:phosphate transport system substrate-binding protein
MVRLVAALCVVLATLVATGASAFALPPVLGGGSGFAALEIDQWRADTARAPFNLTINYVAQGSTFGRVQFGGSQFDYGASDIEYTEEETAGGILSGRCGSRPLGQCFVYVPVSAGGLAFMYNLTDPSGNRLTTLRLSRRAACEIFTGAIRTWNAPDIVKNNPSLSSDSNTINPVIRADGAGESWVMSEFCLDVAPDVWHNFQNQEAHNDDGPNLSQEFREGKPTSLWPGPAWGATAASTADGVADYVANPASGANSITFVAAGYAKVRNFPTASVQNAAGNFTQPDESNVTIALAYATERSNGTFKLSYDGPDPNAYFPSTYSYILVQNFVGGTFNADKGATLGNFLCYAISQGQVIAPQLRYARLSAPLVKIAEDAIAQIPGAPKQNSCFLSGAPPPPPPPVVQGGGGGGGGGSGGAGGGANARNGGGAGGANGSGGAASSKGGGVNGSGSGSGSCVPAAAASAAPTTTVDNGAKGATPTTAKKKASTTTTTVACAAGSGGANGTGDGSSSLDDALLAAAAGNHKHGTGGGTSTIWLLVIGIAVTWAATTAWSKRKAIG